MRELHASVRTGADGRILFVEHEAVYTAGRGTPAAELAANILPVERGGKITYHGPGQLVVYPIVPLPRRDVRDWLQRLEAFGVAVCADLGIAAAASVDGTGVFVAGRKIASIGVAVSHWINLHGIAINVAMDLSAWQRVRPCGLAPEIMSDLSSVAGRPIGMATARAAARGRVFLLTDPHHPV
jgi:lipoyl(octanoyl) transferase